MTTIHKSMSLPYAATDIFALICDVRAYPQFLRWFSRVEIEREFTLPGQWVACACADVIHAGSGNSFTTLIRADRIGLSVNVRLLRGPLRYLDGSWRITDSANGCRVDFTINFEFDNPVLRLLSAAGASAAAAKLSGAFTGEAERRFGSALACAS